MRRRFFTLIAATLTLSAYTPADIDTAPTGAVFPAIYMDAKTVTGHSWSWPIDMTVAGRTAVYDPTTGEIMDGTARWNPTSELVTLPTSEGLAAAGFSPLHSTLMVAAHPDADRIALPEDIISRLSATHPALWLLHRGMPAALSVTTGQVPTAAPAIAAAEITDTADAFTEPLQHGDERAELYARATGIAERVNQQISGSGPVTSDSIAETVETFKRDDIVVNTAFPGTFVVQHGEHGRTRRAFICPVTGHSAGVSWFPCQN